MKKYLSLAGLCFLMASIMAAPAMAAEKPLLNVTGTGVLKVSPDIAYINTGVRTTGKDAESASMENINITKAIVEKLTSAGVASKDIRTQSFYVYPMYDGSEPKRSVSVTGYEVNNSLAVTIRNLEDVGKIIDAAIAGGANSMSGLNYSVEDTSIYYEQLYSKAMEDASKKAQAIAKTMGLTLSAPISVSENGYVNTPGVYRSFDTGMGSMAASNVLAGTYTTPGEIELNASLYVSYAY